MTDCVQIELRWFRGFGCFDDRAGSRNDGRPEFTQPCAKIVLLLDVRM